MGYGDTNKDSEPAHQTVPTGHQRNEQQRRLPEWQGKLA